MHEATLTKRAFWLDPKKTEFRDTRSGHGACSNTSHPQCFNHNVVIWHCEVLHSHGDGNTKAEPFLGSFFKELHSVCPLCCSNIDSLTSGQEVGRKSLLQEWPTGSMQLIGITWFPAQTQVWIEAVVVLRSVIQIDEWVCVLIKSVQSIMCSAAVAVYSLCVCVCKHTYKGDHMVAQLALHYKPKICRSSYQWCQWNFSLARNLQVQLPTVSMEFFIDIIPPTALWPWGQLSL